MLGGIGTAYVVTTTITNVQTIPAQTIVDLNSRLIDAPETFDTTMQAISALLNETVAYSVGTFQSDPFFLGVQTNITLLLSSIAVVETDMMGITLAGDAMQLDLVQTDLSATTLIADATSFLNAVQQLFQDITFTTGSTNYDFAVKPMYNKSSDVPSTLTGGVSPSSFPNVTQLVADTLGTIDIADIIKPLTSAWKNGQGYSDMFTSAISTIQDQIAPYLDQARSYRDQVISSTTGIIVQLASYQETITQYSVMIEPYKQYAFWAVLGAIAIPILITAILTLCLWRRKPRAISCCLTSILPLSALYFLLAMIFYLVATIAYTACSEIFDRNLQDIPPSVFNASALSFNLYGVNLTIASAIAAFTACKQGSTAVQVATQLGADPANFDVTAQIKKQIDGLDIDSIVNSLNLQQTIDNDIPFNSSSITGPVTAFQNSSALNIDISSFLNATDIIEKINSVDKVLSDLNATTLSVREALFDINSPALPSSTDNDTIVTHYTGMIAADRATLHTLNTSSSMVTILAASGVLTADLNAINATIQTTVTDALAVGLQLDIIIASLRTYVANLPMTLKQNTIPNVEVFAGTAAQALLNSLLANAFSCQTLGANVIALKTTVCTDTITIMDGIWWSFFACGSGLIFLIWWFTCSKRRLILREYELPMNLETVEPLVPTYEQIDDEKPKDKGASPGRDNILRSMPLSPTSTHHEEKPHKRRFRTKFTSQVSPAPVEKTRSDAFL